MGKYSLIFILVLLNGCATYKANYIEGEAGARDTAVSKPISHTIYLIGDAGLSPENGLNAVLRVFKDSLARADEKSTALFLGDNIYPAGLPDKATSEEAYRKAKSHLDAQLATVENFKGRPLFIPGTVSYTHLTLPTTPYV